MIDGSLCCDCEVLSCGCGLYQTEGRTSCPPPCVCERLKGFSLKSQGRPHIFVFMSLSVCGLCPEPVHPQTGILLCVKAEFFLFQA